MHICVAIVLICLNVLSIFVTWSFSLVSKLSINGMCVVTLTLATKAISGDMVHYFCVFLDILDAIMALRQIIVDESNHTSNGLKTSKNKSHMFLNMCILENLCFGFWILGKCTIHGEKKS